MSADAPAPDPAPGAAPAPGAPIPPETLKSAMKAFKKRLKLTRLDHESRLGHGPMSSGKKAEVDAIVPPREFPMAVWAELVAQGKLRNTGQGYLQFVKD